MTERKLKWWGAAATTAFALLVYTLTMAPTVSFWDCGEYISAGNMLAVPHPPGMALHHLIARVSILLFTWYSDVGARVNWISALASALIAGTAYLTAFRGVRMFQNQAEKQTFTWVAAFAGILAGTLVTFCDTLWFSSVEAEMYTPAMFFTLMSVYLMMEWTDLRSTPWGDRVLVFVVYMSYLGVNFTMFTVMFVPILCIWVVSVDESKRRMYPLYIAGTLLLSVIYMPGWFFFIALSLAVVSIVLWLSNILGERDGWKLSGMLSLAAVLGWSLYFYIPIRSSLDPIVDEGDPEIRRPLNAKEPSTFNNLKAHPSFSDAFDLENWGEFREYIERKQYGSENMIERSMTRRSNFLNQLFVHENMGYGGYLVQEYTPFKVQRDNYFLGIKVPQQLSVIGVESQRGEDRVFYQAPGWVPKRLAQVSLFVLAHLPLWWLFQLGWRRDRRLAFLLSGLYLFSSFGMLWYVNFADGTQPEVRDYKQWVAAKAQGQEVEYPDPVHMEVRERDYFFTPAFVLVGIFYGMAAALYAQRMRANRKDDWKAHPQFVSFLVLAGFMPVVAGVSNWHENDRHLNWIPYDYSYNLLNSCEPNGILFTNGDNDTFPLWALQYAYGIRPDVRLVNLSLINTDWYIRQMRDIEPRVPVSLTDPQIQTLANEGGKRNPYANPTALQIGPRVVGMPSAREKYWFHTQDIMVMNIVQANDALPAGKRKPVHFAATVGEENMMGLAPYCRMEGMVYTLRDKVQSEPVDLDKTIDLFSRVYKFRGMAGDKFSKGYLDDDSRRLESNYTNIAIQAAMGSADAAKRWLDTAAKTTDSARAKELRAMAEDRMRKSAALIQKSEILVPKEWRTAYFAAQMFASLGKFRSADSVIELARKRQPDELMLDRAQAEVANREGNGKKAVEILTEAARKHPSDYQLEADIATTLANQGDMEGALGHIQKAVGLNPGDQRLTQMAQQLQQRVEALEQMKARMPAPVGPAPVQVPGGIVPPAPVPAPEPKDTKPAAKPAAKDSKPAAKPAAPKPAPKPVADSGKK